VNIIHTIRQLVGGVQNGERREKRGRSVGIVGKKSYGGKRTKKRGEGVQPTRAQGVDVKETNWKMVLSVKNKDTKGPGFNAGFPLTKPRQNIRVTTEGRAKGNNQGEVK